MSAVVIAFPSAHAAPYEDMPDSSRRSLGATVDVALKIHALIVEELQAGWFDGQSNGPEAALADALIKTYGHDFVAIAVEWFEVVYGCDPFTFLRRIAGFRQEH